MVTIRIIVLALLAGLMPASGAVADESSCIGDWSVAAPIVRKEGLVTVEQLSGLVRSKLSAVIVKTTLCRDKGAYAFHLVVRGAHGQLKSVTVDARAPFGR